MTFIQTKNTVDAWRVASAIIHADHELDDNLSETWGHPTYVAIDEDLGDCQIVEKPDSLLIRLNGKAKFVVMIGDEHMALHEDIVAGMRILTSDLALRLIQTVDIEALDELRVNNETRELLDAMRDAAVSLYTLEDPDIQVHDWQLMGIQTMLGSFDPDEDKPLDLPMSILGLLCPAKPSST